MNWRLAVFCIVAAPVIAWLMQIANRSFRRYSERIQNSMGDITRVAKEAIDAHRLIKIFNAEDHQTERFEQVNEHNRALQHETDPRQGHQQSGRAVHRRPMALGQRSVRGDPAGVLARTCKSTSSSAF